MPMKIQVMSDLHLEFHGDHGISFIKSLDPTNVDVLVLAGDIVTLADHYWSKDALSAICSKYKQVVFVKGNHCYYGTDVDSADKYMKVIQSTLPNLHVLDRGGSTTIDGQRFIGGTLWFKYDQSDSSYQYLMNDFHVIDGFVPWVYNQNDDTVHKLKTDMLSTDVVVTHHLPSTKCIDTRYKTSSLNRFFVCDIEQTILDKKPKLWIHGHTHKSVDIIVGQTRILSNPFGYPGEHRTNTFNRRLIIDV